MTDSYGSCPDCGQDKIYFSKARVLVCGNEKCGTIFTVLPSESHLVLRQQIKVQEYALRISQQLIDAFKSLEKARKK